MGEVREWIPSTASAAEGEASEASEGFPGDVPRATATTQ